MKDEKPTRRRRKRKHLPEIISPQALCDLRLQGMSFSEIALKLDITKSCAYSLFRRFQETSYDGYEPISLKKLKRRLQKNIKLEEIAYDYGISVEGLKNYLADHSIDRQLDMEKIKELQNLGWLQVDICSYYGVTRFTIREFIKSHSNEEETL